jgi:LAS superfamily LD-carboxypeptidase LdcB
MPALLPVVLTASQLMLVADVPTLNIEPSCKSAATAAVSDHRDEKACLRDEQAAREQLQQQWDQFSSADRTRCLALSHLGGLPSYVELLTCLQMAQDVKKLPSDDLTTGMGR